MSDDDRTLRRFLDEASETIAEDEQPEYIVLLAGVLDDAMVSAGLDPSDLDQRRALAVGAAFVSAVVEGNDGYGDLTAEDVATAAVLPRVPR